MNAYKKYIAPGAWFEMNYPAQWNEFEGDTESFLFYNPEAWSGNFRITAFRGRQNDYGKQTLRQELKDNIEATLVRIGNKDCAYSKETFEENGNKYESHCWIIDGGDLAYECSFTVPEGGKTEEAVQIITSLKTRLTDKKYPAETIPIRISEIYQINEAYDWVSHKIKELFSIDFQGMEEDIPNIQKLINEGHIGSKKREAWISLGIVLCVILTNETDGMEWCTLIDGNREVPVLVNPQNQKTADPMKLIWSKVRKGETCDVESAYDELIDILK